MKTVLLIVIFTLVFITTNRTFAINNNLALNCSVTSSSCASGFSNSHLTVSKVLTDWNAAGYEYPQWVKIDLGSIYNYIKCCYKIH